MEAGALTPRRALTPVERLREAANRRPAAAAAVILPGFTQQDPDS